MTTTTCTMEKWAGEVTSQNSGLILVDIQYDFLRGSLAVPEADQILPTAYALLDERVRWKAVVASQLEPFTKLSSDDKTLDLWPDHCVQGTKGCELDPGVESRLDHLRSLGREVRVIEKGTDPGVENYSAFKDEGSCPLDEYLTAGGICNVFCMGLAGDYCVKATALAAVRRGYRVFWVGSGIKSVDDESVLTTIDQFSNKVLLLADQSDLDAVIRVLCAD